MTALLRTVIPAVWGALIAYLLAKGWVTPDVAEVMEGWTLPLVGASAVVATAAVYQLARWLERRAWFPDWVKRLLLGSLKQPTYLG